MVATPEIRSSQGRVITVTDAVSTAEVEVTQARTLGVANIPAEHIESTQARLVVPYNKETRRNSGNAGSNACSC